jgi:AcrR family transcriptional regulator
VSTRDRILDAAATVIGEHGLAKSTTKLIAREAGLSEAMLYRHFADKNELFMRVLHERLPPLGQVITRLDSRVGRGDPRETLTEIAEAALGFYLAAFPMTASLFSDAPLLSTFKDWVSQRGLGPQKPVMAVADYLAAEQKAGRLQGHADPEATAALLMGACFQHALLVHFTAQPPAGTSASDAATRLVAQLYAGLAPE